MITSVTLHLLIHHTSLIHKVTEMKDQLKGAKVSASKARKERDDAVLGKLKAIEHARQMAHDKDEAFKLLEQSEWDFYTTRRRVELSS